MPNSFWPHRLQHARLSCPSLSPGVCSDSCPLSQQCYLAISASAPLFSFSLQSFPASTSFPMSWFFTWGGQSIGASALPLILPMTIQGWFPLGLTGLIPLLSMGPSRVFFSTTIWKHQISGHSAFFMVQLSHLYMTTGKTTALTIWNIVKYIFVFNRCFYSGLEFSTGLMSSGIFPQSIPHPHPSITITTIWARGVSCLAKKSATLKTSKEGTERDTKCVHKSISQCPKLSTSLLKHDSLQSLQKIKKGQKKVEGYPRLQAQWPECE